MHVHIDRQPPPIEEVAQRLAARMARDGNRIERSPCPAVPPKDEDRRQRSLHFCHLPAGPKPRHAPPRDNGAYVPELAARVEDDPNLTDGARRCARKLAEYIYRRDRETRTAEITVTYLMRALRRDRRTVQRYLRQLEHAGYISVEVIHAATRMCAGLLVELLAPLFARHHRRQWPQKLVKKDAARKSQNHRLRTKYSRKSWALRCMDGVFRSLMRTIPPLPALT
jgi:broad specificity phosphatase PhoE